MTWKNKHIVIVGPAHPLRGGLATYNERLAREISKNNRVTLLTFSLQYPNFLFPGESQFSNDDKPDDLNIDVCINSINPISWIRAGLKYRKLKPDVMIYRYWMPFFAPSFGVIGRIVKGNKHTKLLAITDNIIPHEQHFYDKPFTRYFLGMLDGAVSMSKQVLNDLRHHFGSLPVSQNARYQAHPLYDNFGERVDRKEACSRLQLDPNRKYILFFGFIRGYKGLDWLLEAYLKASDTLENIDLIVAGEFYEDEAPYKQLVKEHPAEARIHWHTRFIPNKDVSLYFSVCNLVAQTYKSATQSGVSQVAYHFEVPMLITDVGGLSELVPHDEAGWVSQPNVESIADGLVQVYSENRIERYQKALPELKKQFSWEKMVEALSV